MRKVVGLNAALLGGAALLAATSSLSAQIVNSTWNLPNSLSTPPDNASGTDTTAQTGSTNTPGSMTGWYMSAAPNPAFGYTNPGQRDQFYSVEPINNPGSMTGPSDPATGWSFWLQTFTYQGYASQPVTATDSGQAVTPGQTYIFTSWMSFQTGLKAGQGYNGTTLANQTSPITPNTGNLFSFLGIQWENNGVPVGPVVSNGVLTNSEETDIGAGTVPFPVNTSGPNNGSTSWAQYYVIGTAPAGANEALLDIGWNQGGTDGNTGGQSAFADDAHFTVVPEPATLSLLAVGAAGLMVRRRNAAKA